MDAATYNYETFDGYVEAGGDIDEFGTFADRLHAGTPAIDAKLRRLEDGEIVTLGSLWKRQNVVVEFGSFT